jgi:hypothetical protein
VAAAPSSQPAPRPAQQSQEQSPNNRLSQR